MTATIEILTVVLTIVGFGVLAQVLSDRMAVPSVIFLVVAGVAVGPEGIGIIRPGVFGDALSALVGLSVAVIVFEGAFHLRVERVLEAPRETFRLVTLGALLSLLGIAVAVRVLLGTPWPVALLIGSLLVATGPTVITPILQVVPVRERVASTLETEGVVNDVTAAILAVVMFEFVIRGTHGMWTVLQAFVVRFAIGLLVGVIIAFVVFVVLDHLKLSLSNAPQHARLLVLLASIGMYATAETLAAESGIAAVAAGGFVLGNLDIPYRDSVERFKGDLTLLVIAFVFISLASLLSFDDLIGLGAGGVAIVLVVAGLLRPGIVWLATVGDRFSRSERLFVGAMGPRGIIPASVATLFALELQPAMPGTASTLVGTVFLVILATVVLEGGLARHIAQFLDVIPMRVIIVGGGRVGTTLAERLDRRGEAVLIVENDDERVQALKADGWTVHHGDGSDPETLEAAGADNAKVVAVATRDDHVNLLVGQLASNTFDVETVIARVSRPENVEAFEDLDVEPISCPLSVAWSMDNIIERPSISRWMTELDDTGDVQEVSVTDRTRDGMAVSELEAALPDGVHVALLTRDGDSRLPGPDERIRLGDQLTFIGHRDAVRTAMDHCGS